VLCDRRSSARSDRSDYVASPVTERTWGHYANALGMRHLEHWPKSGYEMVISGRRRASAKPADLPVVQSTRFTCVTNLGTALGIELLPMLLVIADEVIA
jgi:hypothetical protein